MVPFLLALAVAAFAGIISKASPLIRAKLKALLTEFREAAEETPNKFDDILADALYNVLIGDDE